MSLQLGGLDTAKGQHEHVRWAGRELNPGDEVVIRIAKNGKVDRPKSRKQSDAKEDLRAQKRYVRMMAKQLGWKIRTK